MVSLTQVVNGDGDSSKPPTVIKIVLDYDVATHAVTVTPDTVPKGATICFTYHKGKVRVVFVSPFNDDGPEMLDSCQRTLAVGGVFHFRCFFKAGEYAPEVESPTGGILDVQPHRP
jgi:hypothetical protein